MAELALKGGKKAKHKAFPLWPQFDDRERKALKEVLQSRVWWRTPATKTLEFEKEFARFHGARHGIAVTNGTAALEVTMSALGIGPGDEVIVPDYTFVATASAVLYASALPVMVDVSLPKRIAWIRSSQKPPSLRKQKPSLRFIWAEILQILTLWAPWQRGKASP